MPFFEANGELVSCWETNKAPLPPSAVLLVRGHSSGGYPLADLAEHFSKQVISIVNNKATPAPPTGRVINPGSTLIGNMGCCQTRIKSKAFPHLGKPSDKEPELLPQSFASLVVTGSQPAFFCSPLNPHSIGPFGQGLGATKVRLYAWLVG